MALIESKWVKIQSEGIRQCEITRNNDLIISLSEDRVLKIAWPPLAFVVLSETGRKLTAYSHRRVIITNVESSHFNEINVVENNVSIANVRGAMAASPNLTPPNRHNLSNVHVQSILILLSEAAIVQPFAHTSPASVRLLVRRARLARRTARKIEKQSRAYR